MFKVEIVPETPGGKLIWESRLGEGWKEGWNFFSHFSWGNKTGAKLTFYSILSEGKSMLAAIKQKMADFIKEKLNPLVEEYRRINSKPK